MAPGGARYKGGTIAAKGIVLGEKGKPIWAAYDDTGNFEKIGEAVDKLENAQVMSGNTYLGYVQAFLAVKAAHSAHSTILSREAYEGETTTFALADGTTIDKPPLRANTWSVVVRDKEALFQSGDLILHESPLDLERLQNIPDSAMAVLLRKNRSVHAIADPAAGPTTGGAFLTIKGVNIGYLTAFYTLPDGSGTQGATSLGGYRVGQDKLWGPINRATIEIPMSVLPSSSDENGYYVVSYFVPSCPSFFIDYKVNVIITLRYQHFDPNQKSPVGLYYEWREANDYCMGHSEGLQPWTLPGAIAKMGMLSTEAGTAEPVSRLHLSIDVAMLTGEAILRNAPRPGIAMATELIGAIPLADATAYGYTPVVFSPTAPLNLDLDGDGQADETTLISDPAGYSRVNVWLGTSDPETDPPDLTRLADYALDLSDRSLLKSISKADLEKTDTYVYRLSNDQLVTSRKGLAPSEVEVSNTTASLINPNVAYTTGRGSREIIYLGLPCVLWPIIRKPP